MEVKITNKEVIRFLKTNPTITVDTLLSTIVSLIDSLGIDIFKNNQTNLFQTLKTEITSVYSDQLLKLSEEKSRLTEELGDIKRSLLSEIKTQTENYKDKLIIESQNQMGLLSEGMVSKINDNSISKELSDKLSQLDSRLSLLTTNQELITKQITNQLTEYKDLLKSPASKGQIGEQLVKNLLSEIYPNEEIFDVSKSPHNCDIEISRENKQKIKFEVKYHKEVVGGKEITKFMEDIIRTGDEDCSGIMISLTSNIAHKSDFHIDVLEEMKLEKNGGVEIIGSKANKKILIYIIGNLKSKNEDLTLKDLESLKEKIVLGVQVADMFNNIFKGHKDTKNNIPESVIKKMKSEVERNIIVHQLFLKHLKESSEKSLEYLEKLKLKEINDYFLLKYEIKTPLTCRYCLSYIGETPRMLSGHETRCRKKYKKPETKDAELEDAPEIKTQNSKDNQQFNEVLDTKSYLEEFLKSNKTSSEETVETPTLEPDPEINFEDDEEFAKKMEFIKSLDREQREEYINELRKTYDMEPIKLQEEEPKEYLDEEPLSSQKEEILGEIKTTPQKKSRGRPKKQ